MSTQDDNENWILGVIFGLLGSIAINTGNNIQSLGLKEVQANHSKERVPTKCAKTKHSCQWLRRRKTAPAIDESIQIKPDQIFDEKYESISDKSNVHPCSSITWVVGTVIFVTGSLLNFASYAFAAQSMLASLESIQFVTNLIFGKFMLKANVSKTMLIGTVLTVMGTILAVQFSSRATLDLRTDDIKVLYSNPAYLAYLIVMIGMLFLLNFVYHYYERRKAADNPLCYSSVVIPLSYSIWSALFGTQSVVQAKVLAELLAVHSSKEENIFRSWFTYFTLLLWILTVGIWLSRLNNALSKFDPLVIIPLLQCSFIFFAIVSGGIFFKEFNEFTATQWVGFWGGVLVMFSGLVLLTPASARKTDEEELKKEVATLLKSKAITSSFNKENEANSGIKTQPIDQSIEPIQPFQSSHNFSNSSNEYNPDELQTAPQFLGRSPRQSLSQSAVTQINAVKDAVIESANMFLTPPTGTNAITNAMVDATRRQEEKYNRKHKLKQLQDLLQQQNPEKPTGDILSREVVELVYGLGLEDYVTKFCVPSMVKELDQLRVELGSPRGLRESLLKKVSEMEQNLFNDDNEMPKLRPLT